jgi:hypothetical protein
MVRIIGILLGALLVNHPIGAQLKLPPTIAEEKPFPELFLPSLDDGRPLSIASFRGQKLVLHVFASW